MLALSMNELRLVWPLLELANNADQAAKRSYALAENSTDCNLPREIASERAIESNWPIYKLK